jgi:hypothetical protein
MALRGVSSKLFGAALRPVSKIFPPRAFGAVPGSSRSYKFILKKSANANATQTSENSEHMDKTKEETGHWEGTSAARDRFFTKEQMVRESEHAYLERLGVARTQLPHHDNVDAEKEATLRDWQESEEFIVSYDDPLYTH